MFSGSKFPKFCFRRGHPDPLSCWWVRPQPPSPVNQLMVTPPLIQNAGYVMPDTVKVRCGRTRAVNTNATTMCVWGLPTLLTVLVLILNDLITITRSAAVGNSWSSQYSSETRWQLCSRYVWPAQRSWHLRVITHWQTIPLCNWYACSSWKESFSPPTF